MSALVVESWQLFGPRPADLGGGGVGGIEDNERQWMAVATKVTEAMYERTCEAWPISVA